MAFVRLAVFALQTVCAAAARRTAVGLLVGKEEASCTPTIKSVNVCVPPAQGKGKHFLENLAGHGAEDLNCIATWCNEGISKCCRTHGELKAQLAGKTAALLHLDPTIFNKLKVAASKSGRSGSASRQPGSVVLPPLSTEQLQRRAGGAKKPQPRSGGGEGQARTHTAGPERQPQPRSGGGAGQARTQTRRLPPPSTRQPTLQRASTARNSTSSGKLIDRTMCMCPIGTRSVNLAGHGPYPKTMWQIQGPDGGKCTTSCDKCTRALAGDRLPCCERTVDGQLGKCGKESKAPNFNGKQCLCGGTLVGKELLFKSNPRCMPNTKCSSCRYDCIDR